jgi:phosphoenolpyruvate carboxykinase (GTP)
MMVAKQMAIRLNQKKRPGCYLYRSDPRDVARVESRTFICSPARVDAGPTNKWEAPDAMKAKLRALYDGCMAGRMIYVIPFSMGQVGSAIGKNDIEITDSPYVVVSMRIMTRLTPAVLDSIGADGEFIPSVHSVGYPLQPGVEDVRWRCNPENTDITHYL